MNLRLMRNIHNAKIAGVCSGIARRMRIDPVLVRLIFMAWLSTLPIGTFLCIIVPYQWSIIGVIGGGIGILSILTYITLWFVMPIERQYWIPVSPDQFAERQSSALPNHSSPVEPWAFDPYTGERIRRSPRA